MKKLTIVKDLESVVYPKELIERLKSELLILENEYGINRDANLEGGYVLILDSIDDVEYVKENIFDLTTYPPEYVDHIECEGDKDYVIALYILNNDFGILCVSTQKVAKLLIQDELDEENVEGQE